MPKISKNMTSSQQNQLQQNVTDKTPTKRIDLSCGQNSNKT